MVQRAMVPKLQEVEIGELCRVHTPFAKMTLRQLLTLMIAINREETTSEGKWASIAEFMSREGKWAISVERCQQVCTFLQSTSMPALVLLKKQSDSSSPTLDSGPPKAEYLTEDDKVLQLVRAIKNDPKLFRDRRIRRQVYRKCLVTHVLKTTYTQQYTLRPRCI